jgi:murein DD-endopeptidase MepM/ murein hydrolase activator NlpD
VYLGTYLEGDFKEYAGSHPGIDIRPETPNQQIFAVLDGKVFKA